MEETINVLDDFQKYINDFPKDASHSGTEYNIFRKHVDIASTLSGILVTRMTPTDINRLVRIESRPSGNYWKISKKSEKYLHIANEAMEKKIKTSYTENERTRKMLQKRLENETDDKAKEHIKNQIVELDIYYTEGSSWNIGLPRKNINSVLQTMMICIDNPTKPGEELCFVASHDVDYLVAKNPSNDPLQKALLQLNDIFSGCIDQSLSVNDSIINMLRLTKTEKNLDASIFFAWKLSKEHDFTPILIAASSCGLFIQTSKFSTSDANIMKEDMRKLKPYFDNYYYIDALCSKHKGAGRILVLHVMEYVLRKKYDGLIGLSFSTKKNTTPASYSMFILLEFKVLIKNAKFTNENKIYGSWIIKDSKDIYKGRNKLFEALCTRPGATEKTKLKLSWRC